MNRKKNRGGGHQRPPDDSLIGASEVAGILGCDRSTISRFAKLGLLKPAVVEDGEVRWFDREWIVLLAAHFTLKRAVRKRHIRRMEEAPSDSVFDVNGAYRPELRKRRPSRAEATTPPRPRPPRQRSQTPRETPKREAPPVPSANGSIRARTQIPPEWWIDVVIPNVLPPNPAKDLEGSSA